MTQKLQKINHLKMQKMKMMKKKKSKSKKMTPLMKKTFPKTLKRNSTTEFKEMLT
jgi:hypothetical protein